MLLEFIPPGFIAGFCKVEFLCHSGDPNWLGWIVLGILGLLVLFVGLTAAGLVASGALVVLFYLLLFLFLPPYRLYVYLFTSTLHSFDADSRVKELRCSSCMDYFNVKAPLLKRRPPAVCPHCGEVQEEHEWERDTLGPIRKLFELVRYVVPALASLVAWLVVGFLIARSRGWFGWDLI